MGTNINNKLESAPYLTYGFEYGNSPMTNAHGFQENMNKNQHMINKIHGGTSSLTHVTVPQFPQIGPKVSPIGANSSSLETNTTSINGKNNALNDSCWAKTSNSVTGGKKHRKTKTNKRRKTTNKRRKTKTNKRRKTKTNKRRKTTNKRRKTNKRHKTTNKRR